MQIRLVVVTGSPNDAERVGSHLRNAGHGVHADWVCELDQLDPLLSQADLVLCASENLPKARLKDVIERCRAQRRHVLVVAMNDVIDVGRTTQALCAGARDLVSLQQMEHLQAVVLREAEHVQLLRKLQEINNRLQQAETRHESLLQDSPEALAYVQEGIHIRVNPAYAKLFGFSDIKSVEGLPLMDLIHLEDRPKLKQHLRQVARGQPDKAPLLFRGLNIDGSHFPLSLRFTPTQIDDENCIEVLAFVEQPAAKPAAAPVAAAPVATAFSGSTGRQALYGALDEALKTAGQQTGVPALLFVRVDNMERLEQRLGFDYADKVFNELAVFMLQSCGPGDQGFRFSAGEFVVLSRGRKDLEEVEQAAKALQAAVGKQVFGDKTQPASLTVSVAALPLAWHSDTQQTLRDARQQIISLQSRQGSGVYVETEPMLAGTQQQEKLWLARIKAALEQNRFRLVYKTIVNLEGESSHYFDALVRMLDDKGEEVHATEFVPIAERHGLMLQIDQWVVTQALLTMGSRQRSDQEYGLFVRLSDSTITSTDKFLPWLLKALKGYPVRPDGLFLTLSETGLLDHMAQAKQLFGDLKKLRIRTAISRFGASPQASQLIEQLPVDFVRLDAAAIKALVNPKASERVSETLKQARHKGVRIVAKQVTDAQTMAMLWTLGVHFIEGEFTPEPSAQAQQTA
ncbi:MAG TPA: EAL domain-containing protein [Nevskiales bacterium]|nr:EAL domain-containing protein [Nevskiales bacterium]